MIINNSEGKTIHTQRNNRIRPYSSCNVTSFVNALKYCDIEYDYPEEMQPEDYFMQIMQSQEAWETLYEKFGRNVGANPWNYSDILVEMCNKILVESDVCEIKYATLEEIKNHIDDGNVLVTSGKFTKSGHFVCIVGYETQKIDSFVDSPIAYFIIDDPFGNYHTQYRDINGDNIKMPMEDFTNLIYPKNKYPKRTQFFYKQ